MTPAECDRQLERIDVQLRATHARRNGKEMLQPGDDRSFGADGVTWESPLMQVIEAEERERGGLAETMEGAGNRLLSAVAARIPAGALMERVAAFVEASAKRAAFEAFDAMQAEFIEWLFAAGPSPLDVVKRLYGFAKMRRPDLLADMSFRQLGVLLGERGATLQARCRELFGDAPAGWKKPSSAVEKMRAAQRGNRNRLGGKKNHHQPTKKTKT